MDWQSLDLDRYKQILGNRRAKAIGVAVMILGVVVLMQVGNLRNNTPMCELLTDCKLRNIDLHRMQIALSKSGLSEFEIQDHKMLVPKSQHADYLQAIAEHNAIPAEIQSQDKSAAVANPFLSRSQQLSIAREAKRKQIQEMVVRLPFVDQAWFEMDEPQSRSAFSKANKSAVISIQPVQQSTLMEQHVDTVRQMIGGAIAGIEHNQIVVIDLSSGFAWNQPQQSPGGARQKYETQQVAFVRQQNLEARIRQALAHYPGIAIKVIVDKISQDNLAAQPQSRKVAQAIAIPSAGANGQASLSVYSQPISSPAVPQNRQTSFGMNTVATASIGRERVSIVIDIPQTLVRQLKDTQSSDRYGSPANTEERTLTKLKSEIENKIRPLIGSPQTTESSIAFNLIPAPPAPTSPWIVNVKSFVTENWPSLGVLVVGMVLILLVTQSGRIKSSPVDSHSESTESTDDVLSLHSAEARDALERTTVGENTIDENSINEGKRAAEVRLSRLIEKDPDAAAKVIESWIRDAA